MSGIEKTGPQGYEYQYILTVYAVLELLTTKDVAVSSLYIEKINREDVLLVLQVDGKQQTLEIQSKSERSQLDAEKLAKWLCHFENRSANSCTLSRLIADNNRSFIIGTASRCTDDCLDFVSDVAYIKPRLLKLTKERRIKILAAIEQNEKNGTQKISASRNQYCKVLATNLVDKDLFEQTMGRVGIWENLDKLTMIDRSCNILNRHFGINQSQTNPTLLQLLEVVKNGRDSSIDIASEFDKEILKHQPYAHKLKNYISRDDESSLLRIIETQGYILLSGHSFSGKTLTGHSLMNHYSKLGYSIQHGNNIDVAQAYLNMSIVEDRVYFLDDPMGHIYSILESEDKFRKIEQLANNLQKGRKLLVTCNNEVLRQIASKTSSLKWNDLTVSDRPFLNSIWLGLCSENIVPQQVQDRITEIISQAPAVELLQPGQLDYLSKNWGELQDWSNAAVIHYAAIDASRIATIIESKEREYQRIYRVIGLLADTIHPVSIQDICMVLYSEEKMPGILENKPGYLGTSLFGTFDKKEEIVFPIYKVIPPPPEVLSQALDFFESRGYLVHLHGGYIFKHPVYRHAALWNIEKLPTFQIGQLIKDLERAVSVLNFENALNATDALSIVFNKRTELRSDMIALADKLRLSIYPSVHDVAFTFLLKRIDYIDPEFASKLRSDIAHYDFDTSHIYWHEGMPIITDKPMNSFERYKRKHENSQRGAIVEIITRLQEAKKAVSRHEAWQVLRYVSAKKSDLTLSANETSELLKFAEGFIRAKAAFYFMSSQTNPELAVVRKLFLDIHPNVVFEAYKGAFKGWPYYSASVRDAILPMLQDALTKEHIVLRSRDLMLQYTAGYTSFTFDWYEIDESLHKDMWLLWATLLPIFFKHFRTDSHFHTPRFVSTIQDSQKFLSPVDTYNVLSAWLEWLSRYLSIRARAETDLYYITYHFIEVADQLGQDRTVLSTQLINHSNFHFAAYTLRVLLANWEHLTPIEKNLIETKVANTENFGFQVVALTSTVVPHSIQAIVCGEDGLMQSSPDIIFSTLSHEMLDACLNLEFGNDMYSYLPSGNSDSWEAVLIHILDIPESPFHKYVVKQMLEDKFFSEERFLRRWQSPNSCIEKLLVSRNPKIIGQITLILLDDLVSTTASVSCEVWKAFLENLTQTERNEILTRVFQCLPAIDRRENIKIVHEIFTEDELQGEYERQYKDDDTLYGAMKTIRNFSDDMFDQGNSRQTMYLSILKAFFSAASIRLSFTVDYCEQIIDEMKPQLDELKADVERIKEDISSSSDKIQYQLWEEVSAEFGIINEKTANNLGSI